MCEARRATSLLDLTLGPAGGRRGRSRDSDPTSTSTGTSGFGAYALSGESVVVVVGNYKFAAGLTRKAAPSACTKLSHYPRRSQDTPGVVHPSTLHQMRVAAVISSGSPRFGRPGAGCGMRALIGDAPLREAPVELDIGWAAVAEVAAAAGGGRLAAGLGCGVMRYACRRRCCRRRRVQAALLCARIVRCFSRFQSRSFSALRLSWSCLPRARPISTLTLFFFQYTAVGTIV